MSWLEAHPTDTAVFASAAAKTTIPQANVTVRQIAFTNDDTTLPRGPSTASLQTSVRTAEEQTQVASRHIPLSPPGAPRKQKGIALEDALTDEVKSRCRVCTSVECRCTSGVMVANADRLVSSAPGFALTVSSELRFQPVAVKNGFVKVATALSLHSSFAGELLIPAHTATDARRAANGDEFYSIAFGTLTCEIGSHRSVLRAGDYIAINHMSCFELHNTSSFECRVLFFAPRNPFG